MTKINYGLVTLALLFSLVSLPVTAQSSDNARKQNCQAAKTVLGNVSKRIDDVAARRKAKYDQITAKLSAVSAKYKAEGIDTTKLDESIKQTQTKIDELVVDFGEHKASIDAAEALDCESDPEAFKAAVTNIRQQRQSLKDSVTVIKLQLKGEVKTELQNLKKQIETKTEQPASDQPSVSPDTPVSSPEETN